MKTVSAEEVFGRRIAISHLENVIGRLQTKVSDKRRKLDNKERQTS